MNQHLDLQTFLKKYTPVPNTFIDDLFTLYGASTTLWWTSKRLPNGSASGRIFS
jgi:hypothetical protein